MDTSCYLDSDLGPLSNNVTDNAWEVIEYVKVIIFHANFILKLLILNSSCNTKVTWNVLITRNPHVTLPFTNIYITF